jgi:hypothetical protein
MYNNITIDTFIKSLVCSISVNMEGGKTKSGFYKSADDLFIVKVIKENEFQMFRSFAPDYFRHMQRSKVGSK